MKGIETGKQVVVTTEFRGVFFGTLTERTELGDRVTLTNARNCVSWSSSIKGFLGLATTGPDDECRIGPAVKTLELPKVTSITEATEAACLKWESAPWG